MSSDRHHTTSSGPFREWSGRLGQRPSVATLAEPRPRSENATRSADTRGKLNQHVASRPTSPTSVLKFADPESIQALSAGTMPAAPEEYRWIASRLFVNEKTDSP